MCHTHSQHVQGMHSAIEGQMSSLLQPRDRLQSTSVYSASLTAPGLQQAGTLSQTLLRPTASQHYAHTTHDPWTSLLTCGKQSTLCPSHTCDAVPTSPRYAPTTCPSFNACAVRRPHIGAKGSSFNGCGGDGACDFLPPRPLRDVGGGCFSSQPGNSRYISTAMARPPGVRLRLIVHFGQKQ